MTPEQLSDAIEEKRKKARKRHPFFPDNVHHAFGLLYEEVGEIAGAVNDYCCPVDCNPDSRPNPVTIEEIIDEGTDAIVVIERLLLNLKSMSTEVQMSERI